MTIRRVRRGVRRPCSGGAFGLGLNSLTVSEFLWEGSGRCRTDRKSVPRNQKAVFKMHPHRQFVSVLSLATLLLSKKIFPDLRNRRVQFVVTFATTSTRLYQRHCL